MLTRVRSFLQSATRRNLLENDIDDEMSFHREAFENDLLRSGVPPAEARRRAQIEFGSTEAAKEECREARGLSLLDETIRNARFAFRQIRRSPGFSAAVIGTLALCIGANTAIFSVVDAVLFRPLPYPEPDRLAAVVRQFTRGTESNTFRSVEGRAWEALKPARSFDLAAMGGSFVGVNLGVDERAVYIQQQRVTTGYFRVLGVPPVIGREFSEEEDRAGGPQAVILSHGIWKRLFHGDPSILGRSILLRGEPHTVVGVASESFRSLTPADLWTPLRPSITGEGGGENYRLVARLKPEAKWPQAKGEAESLGVTALEQARIPRDTSVRMDLLPLQEIDSRNMRDRLMILWAAVGLVLLIGCVNVASLMLARSVTRGREMGTRMALGGGAGSLIRQLGMEAILLGLLGGAAGLAVGYLGIQGFQMIAEQFAIWQELRLDIRVLVGTLFISLAASLLFGLAPALQVTRIDVRDALADGSRAVAGARSHWLRRVLVVSEVALGLVLLIGAGLLVRSLLHLQGVSPGFDSSNVLSASISLQDARYRSAERVNLLYRRTLEQMRQAPGVEAVAAGLHVPYERWLQAGIDIAGVPEPNNQSRMTTMNYVTSDYFRVLRIPLRAGREIDERDSEKSMPVALVNEAFVRQYLQGKEPIGIQVKLRMDGAQRVIVGVVGDIRQRAGFGSFGPLDHLPAVYVPVTQLPDQNFELMHTWFSPNWLVRANGSVQSVSQMMQQTVESVDPLLPFSNFGTLDDEKNRALGGHRINAVLLGSLAGLALILAIVGIYGMVANSVVERTRELGIRMALGATVRQVIWTATRPGLLLCVAGVLIGSILAAMTTGILKKALYGVQSVDPATYISVATGLFVIGAIASLIPALRLARLNPTQALRQE